MKRDAAVVRATPAPDAAPVSTEKTFVTGAGRCGECHEKMYEEWELSAHANAGSSPLYVAALARSPSKDCGSRCHTPLASRVGPTNAVATEGVTCDVCHTLRAPTPDPSGSKFELAITDMVKFGPRCDLKDHYFHRMGCSVEHTQATICGSCHWYERGAVPVFTEFPDWRDVYKKPNEPCQTCHMPKEKAAIAVGSPQRDGVPHHGWRGIASDLRQRAVGLAVDVKPGAVTVTLTNTAAGHYVPAGLPERRIEVVATSGGTKKTWTLGRELVDDEGKLVPFWLAKKVGRDTRIAPGASWTGTWDVAAGEVDVEVRYVSLDATIAEFLQIVSVHSEVIAKAHASLGKPVKLAVPPPGKRKK